MAERKVSKFPKLLKKPNIPIHSEKPKHDDVSKVEYSNIRKKTLIGEGEKYYHPIILVIK